MCRSTFGKVGNWLDHLVFRVQELHRQKVALAYTSDAPLSTFRLMMRQWPIVATAACPVAGTAVVAFFRRPGEINSR